MLPIIKHIEVLQKEQKGGFKLGKTEQEIILDFRGETIRIHSMERRDLVLCIHLQAVKMEHLGQKDTVGMYSLLPT